MCHLKCGKFILYSLSFSFLFCTTTTSGQQTRDIKCTRISDGSEVNLELCDEARKPAKKQDCNTQPCEAKWHVGLWEGCSSTCGSGVQVRSVFCQQLTHDDMHTIVDSGLCKEEKPATVQNCNTDVACPQWEVSGWSKCNHICGLGEQTREVICKANHELVNSVSDILAEQNCDIDSKPVSSQECTLQPCEGREWVTSKWSGCHGSCSHGFETRQVVCSTQNGKILNAEQCDSGKKPIHKRACSDDHQLCDNIPKWVASQWEDCSAECGPGVQSRKVMCAVKERDMLHIVSSDQCDVSHKMEAHRDCNGTACQGIWFSAPWGKCSEVCGGGERLREVLCFWDREVADNSRCDFDDQPYESEMCNTEACNEDDLIPVGGCKNTQFGCCPDGFTVAEDVNKFNCPSGDKIPTGLCIETTFGCCLDGVHAAEGPFLGGCRKYSCQFTDFGCCPDGLTPSDGFNNEGCQDEPAKRGCEITAYGCCPDGKTASPSPNHHGCPPLCKSTRFGCCPDMKTAALDHNLSGCEDEIEGSGEDCADTKYGCCDDGITAAQGKHGHGCNELPMGCENTVFGCCPDGITPLNRRHSLEDCPGYIVAPSSGCADSRFGCCPDQITPRLGYNNEGCESTEIEINDCENTVYGCCTDGYTISDDEKGSNCPISVGGCVETLHGCCPDGETVAIGPDGAGCETVVVAGCASNYYGCCPDGTTPAEGFNLEGCNVTQKLPDCDLTKYGCCPDGISVAAGDSFDGCPDKELYKYSCSDSPFGCCADGKTAAKGPFNALCPDRIKKGAACGMIKERGLCSNYSIQWYFDSTYGDCTRFWYGGCGGNENRFHARQQCHERCREPVEDKIDVCYLPKSVGRCSNHQTKYFYNVETQNCESFAYGGCNGNKNRFDTQEECDSHCVIPQRPDVCKQPQTTGPCKGQFLRWFYDSSSGLCRQFIYGGCKGNENRFESEADCQNRCKQPSTKICALPKDAGPCKESEKIITRWYFNIKEKQCEQFTYGGCKGNANRFGSKSECEQGCSELIPKKEVDMCQQPKDQGRCKGYFERYFFNPNSGYCESFVYGGCEGNNNRFQSEVECRLQCDALAPVDVCTLTNSVGSCNEYHVRFYFDTVSRRCEKFVYSGCDGNANRFDSLEECGKACKHLVKEIEATGTEHCLLKPAVGPCIKNIPRWYYNVASEGCEQFVYGGCEGNRNRFLTHILCEEDCAGVKLGSSTIETPVLETTHGPTTVLERTTTESLQQDVCSMDMASGDCFEYVPMWYYESFSDSCKQFIFGGCGGNDNKFSTRQECERRCAKPEPVGLEICALASAHGPCVGEIDRWYYDAEKGRCLPFSFGGCEGNQNNFATEHECVSACPTEEICELPEKVGPCRANKLRYYFNQASGQCLEFYYGGCNGNANRFLDIDSCERVCTPETDKGEDTCNQPKDVGRCTDYEVFWYYDPAESRCAQFYYGGCAGNGNKFKTREMCEQRCQATTTSAATHSIDSSDKCLKKKDPGICTNFTPVWYFESKSRTCRRFLYGGCGGNGNNFSTRDECQNSCLYGRPVGRVTKTQLPDDRTTTEGYTSKSTSTASTYIPQATTQYITTTYMEDKITTPYDLETPAPGSVEVCLRRQERGRCQSYSVRYFFDHVGARCSRFWYGGCGTNGNNFETQQACESHCLPRRATPKDKEICELPVDAGPCKASVTHYYYNSAQGACQQFIFGGCLGNHNNFETLSKCEEFCGGHSTPTTDLEPTRESCALPKDAGPCFSDYNILQFYYDTATGECRPFSYGGCPGNSNRFETQERCYQMCSDYPDSYPLLEPADCYERRDEGPCQSHEPRWYFDSSLGVCTAFHYGGCGGNRNNFREFEDCDSYCTKVTVTCGVLQCDMECPYGFARSDDGCPICECADACQNYECPEHHRCVLEEVMCVGQPCLPAPVCVPIPKSGECPMIEQDQALCLFECAIDHDCPDEAKCCDTGCGKICASPGVPGCEASVFGCCPDGNTTAKGYNNIGCDEQAPVIQANLQIMTTKTGDTVLLPCPATGAPTPQISWYKDRVPLQKDISVNPRLARYNDGSLAIFNVEEGDSSNYSCRAYNSIGSDTHTYTLVVQVPPSFRPSRTDLEAVVGDVIELECVLTRGNPRPSVRWYHNNELVVLDGIHFSENDENVLLINSVEQEHHGKFRCEVNNGVGRPLIRMFTLNVKVPEIPLTAHIEGIQNKYKVNDKLLLYCIVTTDKKMSITWYKDDIKVSNRDTNRVEENDPSQVFIQSLNPEDKGTYKCVVTTEDGQDTAQEVFIDVQGSSIPENCEDQPQLANCVLITEYKYCNHPYYKKICCKSCHEAGLMPAN